MRRTCVMQSSLVALVLVTVACKGSEPAKQVDVGSSGSAAVAHEELPHTGPHSGAIERIAVTDDGTVAYTLDTFGQGRLWLALDGTREPIVARGGRATRVALGRTDDGLVAALVDEAGGLELVRFDRDGRTRGHIGLAPEPGFLDIGAAGGGILARRRDEVLVWYDAAGKKRGQIAADAGERIAGIATRHGRVIAALVSGQSKSIALRWVVLDGSKLAWGERQKLRGDMEAPIALSPDGTKVAGIDGKTKRFEIVSLATGDGMYAMSADSAAISDSPAMGFLDDNTAVFSDARGTVWWALALKDPWATSRRGAPSESSDIAVGDRVMLDSSSTSLTLTTEVSLKYLGYRDVGPSILWPTPEGIATQRGTKSVWLDRDLRERVTHVAPMAQVSAIAGDQHVVVSEAGRIYVLDTTTQEEKQLGTYQEAAAVSYDAASRVIVVTTQRRVERFQLDLAPFAVRPLLPFGVEKSFGQVTVMDPATTGGIVAVVSTHVTDGVRLDWFREMPGAREVTNVGTATVTVESMPIGADRKGVVYFVERAEAMLVMHQLDQPRRVVPLAITDIATGAPHPDGTLVILATASELVALDTQTGEQRWKLLVPGIDTLKFSTDGHTLFASAQGGLVSIEPRNGTRIATACGWNFGLHDDQVSAQVFAVPNLCAGLE